MFNLNVSSSANTKVAHAESTTYFSSVSVCTTDRRRLTRTSTMPAITVIAINHASHQTNPEDPALRENEHAAHRQGVASANRRNRRTQACPHPIMEHLPTSQE